MASAVLFIGNKNYSSWSLRPWLVMKQIGAPFDEVLIRLYEEDSKRLLLERSPAGKVPVLQHGDVTVWDSLAICEYLAEEFPAAGLWPRDRAQRALARALSCEMHSGFGAMREHLTMNVRRRIVPQPLPEVDTDVQRVIHLLSDCLAKFGGSGPFLFNHFTVADAMYAPVMFRFRTYGIRLEGAIAEYSERMLAMPAMREWEESAVAESFSIPRYENA